MIIFHIICVISKYYIADIKYFPDQIIYYQFDLNGEFNIPTIYQGLMIFLSSINLYLLGYFEKKKKYKNYFYAMSTIFCFLAWDEIIGIHENFTTPLRNILNPTFFLYEGWTILYGILTLLFFLIFYKFILKMPSKIRNLIFTSGFFYVFGELVMEYFSGKLITLKNYVHLSSIASEPLYIVFYTLEEAFALIGILIFNFALLTLIRIKIGNFRIDLID